MSTLKVNSISPRTGTKLSVTGSIESTQPILSASHALQADAALTAVTASYAVSASHEIVSEVSSSHAINADIAPFAGLTGKPTLLSGSTQIASEISGSFGADSASLASRIASNDTDISTNTTEINVLSAATSSYALSTTAALKTAVSGAFAVASSSLASRIVSNDTDIATNLTEINVLSAATSSYLTGADTGSFATLGSNTFTGNQVVSSSILLTLQPSPTTPSGIATGSLIISGSPVQLYIYNGSGSSGWNRV